MNVRHEEQSFHVQSEAANHQVIGTSQTYKTAESREEGIASVKANAASAPIVDES